MLESYPQVEEEFLDDSANNEMELLFGFIKEVRNYKITNQLSPNTRLNLSISLKIKVSEDFATYLRRFTFSDFEVKDSLEDVHGELFSFNYGSLAISAGTNTDEIKAKLEKDIAFEKSEIERGERMLNNPNFLAKAPKDKVENEQNKLALHKQNLQELEEKLKKL